MAERTSFLGDVRKGDRVQFPVEYYSVSGSWTPRYFDVIDNNTRALVIVDRQLDPPDTDTDLEFIKFIDLELADIFDTDANRDFTWVEGRHYTIVVKSQAGEVPTDAPDAFLFIFRVEPGPAPQVAHLGLVEKGKTFYFMHREENRDDLWFDVIDPKTGTEMLGNQPLTKSDPGQRLWHGSFDTTSTDDYVIGRTYFIRVKDKAADDPNLDTLYSFTILPPIEAQLRRLLALGGENMVLDNFAHDQSGNITRLRVRLFSNADDADRATAGVTDPEPGEIASYVVTQEHDVPRNVRTFHKSVLEFFTSTFPGEG